VIVVEDEAKIRRFIKLALEAEQLDVFEADSVARGLIEVGTRQPDLVVLDLGLPDGDGIDLIRDVCGPGRIFPSLFFQRAPPKPTRWRRSMPAPMIT
jgi:DNA-binding response OmpR family regulator